VAEAKKVPRATEKIAKANLAQEIKLQRFRKGRDKREAIYRNRDKSKD
jgi:hypothetical protein